MTSETANPEAVREKVREGYGAIARQGGSCCGPAKSCCGSDNTHAVATGIGYDEAELAALPEGADMGLSCGNPDSWRRQEGAFLAVGRIQAEGCTAYRLYQRVRQAMAGVGERVCRCRRGWTRPRLPPIHGPDGQSGSNLSPDVATKDQLKV